MLKTSNEWLAIHQSKNHVSFTLNLSPQTSDDSLKPSVICILNGAVWRQKFNRPTSYIINASSKEDWKLPMPFEHGHQINERQVQWRGLVYSTFQQDLGWKKEPSLQNPPPFRPPTTCLWRKQIFLWKFFLEWLFYQQAGPWPSSFFWLVQEREENKKTKQQGGNGKKGEVQKEAEETAVGEVSWRFPAINFRLSRLPHLKRIRARGG